MNATDPSLKERRHHGSQSFPCGLYRRVLGDPLTDMQYHWHDEIEMIYFSEGRATLRVNTDIYTLDGESIFFVNPGELHKIIWHTPCQESAVLVNLSLLNLEYLGISFQLTHSIATGSNLLPRMISSTCGRFQEIKKEYQDIVDLFQRFGYVNQSTSQIITDDPNAQFIIQGCLIKILGYLSEVKLLSSDSSAIHNYGDCIVKELLTYIWKNYPNHIGIPELAKIANMNESYFCRFFKKYVGKTAISYLNEYRIHQAALLLEKTDMSVTTICLECGFNNVGNFFNQFKRIHGMTPMQYRKTCCSELSRKKGNPFSV